MTTKVRTLIIDDESLARKRIVNLLKTDNEIVILAECINGTDAVNCINKHQPDLIFLDVQMPELNGFEVIGKMEVKKYPVIIFVTAYDKYALKAFEVHALDYLLKPFDDERFYEALKFAKDYFNQSTNDFETKINNLLSDIKIHSESSENIAQFTDRLVIKSGGKINFIKTANIIRIKADGKYLEIATQDGKHLQRQTMNEIESKLDPKKFFRVHRSTIINIDFIKEMQNWHRGEYIIILLNGEKFTTGHNYRINIEKLLASSN